MLKNLFPDEKSENILGRVVLFNSQPFKIIGVLQKDTDKPIEDNVVRLYIPYTTLMNKLTGDRNLREIIVKVKDDVSSTLAENAIIRILEIKRGQKDFLLLILTLLSKLLQQINALQPYLPLVWL